MQISCTNQLTVITTVLTMLVVGCGVAYGKARYLSKSEMIAIADVIAIVNIDKVEEAPKGKRFFTYYGQKAFVSVEKLIKGAVGRKLHVYGDEDFICAQTHLEPGRALLFLSDRNGILSSCNWHRGNLAIDDDSVDWFTGEGTPMRRVLLQETLADIQQTIAKLNPPKKFSKNPVRQPRELRDLIRTRALQRQ